MKCVFADACYWIALISPQDELHSAATSAKPQLKHAQVVTTDEVLGELLNFFCERGSQLRSLAASIVDEIRKDPRVTVVEQSRDSFDGGFGHYKARADKEYSLVDCVSFELMTRDSITEALTNDHHFVQAGFIALLK